MSKLKASRTHAMAQTAPGVPTVRQKRFELYQAGAAKWAVVAYTPRLAGSLNATLGTYPADTRFTAADEPLFRFGPAQLAHVLAVLGLRGAAVPAWLK